MPIPPAGPPVTAARPPARSDLEALLSEASGVPVRLKHLERLTPWAVLRARTAGPGAGLPASVIVKWLRDDPDGLRDDPRQVHTELAALRFLSEDLGLGLAPRVLAADPAAPILLLEDLAPRTPLDRALRYGGALPPPPGLASFARALGELGAATAGHAEAYYARRSALGPVDARADRVWPEAGVWPRVVEQAAAFGTALPDPAGGELAGVVAELADPGPFLSLTNGDAEANNFLVAGDDGRLIDFEFAGYRHTLTSAVCLYVPGPAWLAVGDPVATGLEAAHRGALARSVREAEDDRLFGYGLACACLTWAAARLVRFPVLDARPAGDPSRIQMVSVLESAAGVAADRRALPHLAGWARRAALALRRRWPDADVDPAALAPYTPRH
ncbi:hypothetical protein [Planobispora takensis]|uniref:Aminoglycoside phosphotransferase domain-containing protein n=1 Tax=Planobispora takensis TaxID=1367882 RepID=A0A8J3T6N9_9ACTN|nr:hypothetical protein [Planobispora takensis]GII05386.1 hypothetical protein Pta02_73940 [Planobispora takensis]